VGQEIRRKPRGKGMDRGMHYMQKIKMKLGFPDQTLQIKDFKIAVEKKQNEGSSFW
jgi:3-deoxy-D-manno-octulosonic acid (KDO) 8-phosphate synthase